MKIELSCCLCPETLSIKIDTPDGWVERYDTISSENGFCPNHTKVAEFAKKQCPGCVGGWGDCDMWRSFAYDGRRNLSENDFAVLRKGRCPKRTNGTMCFGPEGVKTINLSEVAEDESGVAFAEAIKEYWKRYPEC